jgi:glyoxylase-like metal-dependent hydrolase (beta-lactamase superfamily II)
MEECDMRKTFLGCVLASASVMLGVQTVEAQRNFDEIQIEAQHVAGNVYMLVGSGGNIGVSSGPDGSLMVDDQFAPLADKIRAALRELGQDGPSAELKFVLNTHWHGDHTGGNVEFGPEATVVAHANVRKRLSTREDLGGGRTQEPQPVEALPVITFGDSLSIHFNGEEIRAIHFPHGHTDGDAVIFFTGANVVHMGDDFFSGRFPFVDLAAGGSVKGLNRAVGGVLDQIPSDAQVIPGHGPLSTVDDLRAYHRMLAQTIGIVEERIGAGQSADEVKAGGLPAEWADWGTGFINTERWLETVYQSLTREGAGGQADAGSSDHTHRPDGAHAAHGDNYGDGG